MIRWGLLVAMVASIVLGREGMAMQIETGALANGMNVVVVPDHRSPVALHSVWYRVGSMDEKPGKTGLSHMLEHLMFKGSKNFPGRTMDFAVARNGGIQNAFTSREMTVYHQNVAKEKLPLMMEMEADRMNGLQLTDELFQPERSVVAEERKLRIDSKPLPRFFEKLERAHYSHHPYGVPVIGWAADIAGYTHGDALDWYRQHYAPNNATLLIVGDVTLKEVMPLAEKTYGKVPVRKVPAREAFVEPARPAAQRFIALDKDVEVPVYVKTFRVPSFFQGVAGAKKGPEDAMALWALAEVFGGSDTARLYKHLVMDKGLADAASVSYDGVMEGESTFDLHVTPKAGVPMDKLEAAVLAEVAELVAHGVTADELERAKISLLADEVYSMDDSDGVMYRLGSWLMAGGTPETFENWQKTLKALTPADLQRVAKAYLVDAGSTVGVLAGSAKALGTLKPTM